jgi:RNA polymerase sigma-70 factor, ECF subfamily
MVSTIPAHDTDQIWAEFGARLRAFIASRVESDADADDILQEVFVRIHRHAGTVQHRERLVSWLFQVTRNAIADYYRAPERRRELHLETIHDLNDVAEADGDSPSAWRELAACLRPMVEQLPPHYRDAVLLVDLQGLSQQEAATRAGLSLSGMKSRVQRGRQALEHLLHACCHLERDAGGRVADYQLNLSASGCSPCANGCGQDR